MLSMITNFFGGILSSVGGIISELLYGLVGGIFAFLTELVDGFNGLFDFFDSAVSFIHTLYTGFLSLLSAVFPFIPADWFVLIGAVLIATIFGIIIRKKVL